MKFTKPNRLIFQFTPSERPKDEAEKAPEVDARPKDPEQEAVLGSVAEGKDQLAALREQASERKEQLGQTAETPTADKKTDETPAPETPDNKKGDTPAEVKPKEEVDKVTGAMEGALGNIFKKIMDALKKLFGSFSMIGSAPGAKKILDNLKGKEHKGYEEMKARDEFLKGLKDLAEAALQGDKPSSTTEYIGTLLGANGVTDAEDLYLGLKNTMGPEKEKYISTRSTEQKFPVGSVLFFSAKTEEKDGVKKYGGMDDKHITHAAIVVKSGTLSELTLRFVSGDGSPNSDSKDLIDQPFNTAGSIFGNDHFVGALYNPKDLEAEAQEEKDAKEAEKAEADKPAVYETASPETPKAETTTAPVTEAPVSEKPDDEA